VRNRLWRRDFDGTFHCSLTVRADDSDDSKAADVQSIMRGSTNPQSAGGAASGAAAGGSSANVGFGFASQGALGGGSAGGFSSAAGMRPSVSGAGSRAIVAEEIKNL